MCLSDLEPISVQEVDVAIPFLLPVALQLSSIACLRFCREDGEAR